MLIALLESSADSDAQLWVAIGMLALGVPAFILAMVHKAKESRQRAALSPEERLDLELTEQSHALDEANGSINSVMICPHCQTRGYVRTKLITQKQGISGGKATAALLTGGASLVAVGLSKKGKVTKAHCDACNNDWMF